MAIKVLGVLGEMTEIIKLLMPVLLKIIEFAIKKLLEKRKEAKKTLAYANRQKDSGIHIS